VMAFPRGQLIRPKMITPMTPGMMRYRVSPQEEGLVRQRLEEALPKIAPALQRKLRSAVTI